MKYFLADAAALVHWGQLNGRPDSRELSALRVGDFVKLCFCQGKGKDTKSERMWVVIERIEGEKIVGALRNTPATITGLELGDEVHCEQRHVYDTRVIPSSGDGGS